MSVPKPKKQFWSSIKSSRNKDSKAGENQQPQLPTSASAPGSSLVVKSRQEQEGEQSNNAADGALPTTTEASRDPISNDPTSTQQFVKPPTFWERAYREILEGEDRENGKILRAYDLLLDRAARVQDDNPGDEGKDMDTEEDHPAAKYSDSAADIQDQLDIEEAVTRRVGNEQEMRNIAAAKLREMQQKEWKLKWKGREIFNVREQVTRIVKLVDDVSGLVSNAAALDPLHAGMAWAGVCVLLPLIVNDTDERQKAIDGVEVMARITARYRTVEDDYTSGLILGNEEFEKALVTLYRGIATFYIKAACYFAMSTFGRTWRGIIAADAWTAA